MTTEMHFYDDVYERELDATVLEYGIDEKSGPFFVLDRTIFHPHGGGQKGDRGRLTFSQQPFVECPSEVDIVDTRGEKGGAIRHIIANPLAEGSENKLSGAGVCLRLDWGFRFTQMRLHSTSHLIHIFMERHARAVLPPPRISDILADYGLNIYESILDFKPEDMPNIVANLNDFLVVGHQIVTFPDPDQPTLRYWRCDDVTIPCGGTHPHNTMEIGPISASLSVKKGKTKVMFRVSNGVPTEK
jgi:alanyl-tRNA synthetase/misacylated tRNA(Ala) deacylase